MNKKVLIIGAGFTGLTAAYTLMKKGYEVTIYEKGKEIGGLASGFELEGTHIEKAYHHIFKSDTDIIDLVNELQLSEKLMWLKSSMGIYYNHKIYPFGTPLSIIRFKPLDIISRLRYCFVLLYLSKEKYWRKFTKVTAIKWMSKYSGQKSMNIIWYPLLKGKFSKYYDQISMSWLWARIYTRAHSQEKGGEKLGYFKGGFNILVSELEIKLKKGGVNIITDCDITNINEKSEQVEVISNKESFLADCVIATVPSHIFGHLINKSYSEYIKKLNSVEYLGAVTLVFSSSQNIGDYYWNNINDLNIPFIAFINHTKLVDKSLYNDKYIYYLGAYIPYDHKYFSMNDDEIKSIWFDSLKTIYPYFDKTKAEKAFLFKFKNAQHIVDINYEAKIPPYETPLKNVYLSNFSQIFPEDRGTNYAIREGRKIADLADKYNNGKL